MAWNDYLSILSSGLAANRPTPATNLDYPTVPRYYLSLDNGSLDVWNPTTKAWAPVNGSGLLTNIASAGATQGSATPITSRTVIVATATASSKGVQLPAAATGVEVTVVNAGPTFGVKVYPFLHGTINAGASNVADTTVLAALKTTIYLAINATKWVTLRGG